MNYVPRKKERERKREKEKEEKGWRRTIINIKIPLL